MIPHEKVELSIEDLAAERDTVILRAVDLLEKGFPRNVVPYNPKNFMD